MDDNSLFVDFDGQVRREWTVDLPSRVEKRLELSGPCVEAIGKDLHAGVVLHYGVAMFQGIGERTAKKCNVSQDRIFLFQ